MKRFYRTASAGERQGGWQILLDDRPIKTPNQKSLLLPSARLAKAVAEEWAKQQEKVDMTTMPLNRMANTALDRVTGGEKAIIDQLVGYGRSDMLCYRASDPEPLSARQARYWDPPLGWLAMHHGVELAVTQGLMPIDQPVAAMHQLADVLSQRSAFELTGLLGLVTGLGSLTLGLALADKALTLDEAWTAATVDETFQAEQWGSDSEAVSRQDFIRTDVAQAFDFINKLL